MEEIFYLWSFSKYKGDKGSLAMIRGGNIIFFTKIICILFLDKPTSESKVNNAE